jgi:hypothetical protein
MSPCRSNAALCSGRDVLSAMPFMTDALNLSDFSPCVQCRMSSSTLLSPMHRTFLAPVLQVVGKEHEELIVVFVDSTGRWLQNPGPDALFWVFRRTKTVGDGNCFYESVAIALNKGGKVTKKKLGMREP